MAAPRAAETLRSSLVSLLQSITAIIARHNVTGTSVNILITFSFLTIITSSTNYKQQQRVGSQRHVTRQGVWEQHNHRQEARQAGEKREDERNGGLAPV